MEQTELESLIGDVEVAIDRLRSLYDQYFMGIERIEPGVARKDVDRKIYVLRREQIRNTALRFRFQMVLQRYNTFQSHWQRICREIENGTYKRHMLRAEQRFGRGGAKKESLAPPAPSVAPSNAPPPVPGSPAMAAFPAPPRVPGFAGPPPGGASPAGASPGGTPPAGAPPAGAPPAGAPPPLPTAARGGVPGRFKPAPGAALPADLAAELAELDKDFAPAPAQDDTLLAAARARQPGAAPPLPPASRDSLAPRPGKPPLPRPSVGAPPAPVPVAAAKPALPTAAKPAIATQTPTAVRAPNATLLATMAPPAPAATHDAPTPAASAARPARPVPANPSAPIARPAPSAASPTAAAAKPAAPSAANRAPPAAKPAAPVAAAAQAKPQAPSLAQAPVPPPAQTPTVVRPVVSVPTPLMAFPPPAQVPREALRPSPPPPPQPPPARAVPSPLPPRPPARPASVPVPRPPPKESSGDDLSDHRVRQLYVEFVESKRRQNESTAAITYETVAKSLRDSSERLRQRHGKPIDFEIAIRDGKTFLKPVLK